MRATAPDRKAADRGADIKRGTPDDRPVGNRPVASYLAEAKFRATSLVLAGLSGVEHGDLAALKERPVGVLRMSGAEALLREQGFTRVAPAAEEWTNARRLREHRIDAWLGPGLMLHWAWRETGGDPAQLVIGQVVRPSEIWFTASPDIAPEIVALWHRHFQALKTDGSYNRITARYARLQPEPAGERSPEIPWGTRG